MAQDTFTIVFQKLAEATSEVPAHELFIRSEASIAEIEEIAELRRIVLEITDPEPMSYTST
jgi:hypothetical protein